jgi:hypothetical protein
MKQFILAITILLASCAGPSREYSKVIPLKAHKIVITDYSVGKYTQVRFVTQVDIEGYPMTFVGSNGNTGYYYKKYNLKPGDTLTENINLILDDEHLYVESVNLDKYLKK